MWGHSLAASQLLSVSSPSLPYLWILMIKDSSWHVLGSQLKFLLDDWIRWEAFRCFKVQGSLRYYSVTFALKITLYLELTFTCLYTYSKHVSIYLYKYDAFSARLGREQLYWIFLHLRASIPTVMIHLLLPASSFLNEQIWIWMKSGIKGCVPNTVMLLLGSRAVVIAVVTGL